VRRAGPRRAARGVRCSACGRRTVKRPNRAGNLIVAYVVWDNGDPVSLSDTTGNTYQIEDTEAPSAGSYTATAASSGGTWLLQLAAFAAAGP
jgi:hypothetical protein